MVTDLVRIRSLAAAKEDENVEFRRHLTAHHPAHDALRHVAEHVAEQIDCRTCANCCRETTVEVTDEDIETIAGFLDASPADVTKLYTVVDPFGTERILKQTPDGCVFLAGNLCSIYVARPRPCREFPYLLATATLLGSRAPSIFGRACLCPIVYNSLEEFKKLTGFHPHHIRIPLPRAANRGISSDQEALRPMSTGFGHDLKAFDAAFVRQRTDRSSNRPTPTSPEAKKLAEILAIADIRVNGDRAWDLQVHNERFFDRVLAEGSIGAGESYMDGWWDVEALDEFFARVHRLALYKYVMTPGVLWLTLKGRIFNRQTKWLSRTVAEQHYDLGNDVYQIMLDRRMQYTCAYWPEARTLDEAQEKKLNLICRKLGLRPGMTVLELGGGFGGLAHFAASEYGCEVVSYNISREQVAWARELCQGLPVRFEEKDYREAAGEPNRFDRVVSIGLCEHVGYKNYRGFLELAHDKLKSGGLFLLHTIGANESATSTDPWIDRYIFPGGMLPSIAQLGKAMERLWVVEDWHNFGPDYDRTLMAWWDNFARGWVELRDKYGDRFYRMWKFYILGSAGGFRARNMQLWQLVLSKGDVPSYAPVR